MSITLIQIAINVNHYRSLGIYAVPPGDDG
jgi:hypothetical protein